MSGLEPAAVRSRPRDVWVASILLMVFGALGALLGLVLLSLVEDQRSHGQSVGGATYGLVLVSVVLAVAEIASGAFVLIGREWARRSAIAICSLNALAAVVTLVSSAALQACVGIALNVSLIVALNKDDVRTWCR
jgi:hypothetical protein